MLMQRSLEPSTTELDAMLERGYSESAGLLMQEHRRQRILKEEKKLHRPAVVVVRARVEISGRSQSMFSVLCGELPSGCELLAPQEEKKLHRPAVVVVRARVEISGRSQSIFSVLCGELPSGCDLLAPLESSARKN